MPGFGNSGYGNGGSYTSAGYSGGPAASSEPTDYLRSLMRNRGGGGASRRPSGGPKANYAAQSQGGPQARSTFGGRGMSSAEKALPGMAARDQLIQMQTMQRGPQVQHAYSGGHYLGLQPKTETMSGYERQAYLPQGSEEIGLAAPSRASVPGITGIEHIPESGTRADFFGTGTNLPGTQDQITMGRDAEFRRFLESLQGGGRRGGR